MKIELAHDSLALKVYDKVSIEEKTLRKVEKFIHDRYVFYESRKIQNRKVLLTKEDLDYVNPYLNKVDIKPEEQQFVQKSQVAIKKRRRALLALAACIFICLSGMAGYSYLMKGIAEQNAAQARKSAQLAVRSEALARKNEQKARDQAKLAKEQTKIAQEEAENARLARQQAEAAQRETDRALRTARQEYARAEEQRRKADSALLAVRDANAQETIARKNAEEAQKIARNEADKARKLWLLSIAQSMAARSIQLEDDTLKAKVARQAYQFNSEHGGRKYDRTIYQGLYDAIRKLEGDSFNEWVGHKSAVRSMVFVSDGDEQNVYSTGSDGQLLKWNWAESFNKGNRHPLVVNKTIKRSLCVSPDGKWLVAGGDRNPYIQLFDLSQTGIDPLPVSEVEAPSLDIEFLPDGSGFLVLAADSSIRLYRIGSGTSNTIVKWESPIQTMAVHPNGSEITAVSQDGQLLQWDISMTRDTSPLILMEKNGLFEADSKVQVNAIRYNHQGNRLAIGDKKGVVWIFDLETRQAIPQLLGHNARISDLAFSADDEYLATASYDGSVQIWIVGQDEYMTRLPIALQDHEGWVMSLTFSPDGKYLVTGGRNGQIKIWPTQPQELAEGICQHLRKSSKSFTEKEWALYVDVDIPQGTLCEETPSLDVLNP